MLDFYVKTRIRFALRDKRLFGITEVEITRVDCISFSSHCARIDNNIILESKPIYLDRNQYSLFAKMTVVWHQGLTFVSKQTVYIHRLPGVIVEWLEWLVMVQKLKIAGRS